MDPPLHKDECKSCNKNASLNTAFGFEEKKEKPSKKAFAAFFGKWHINKGPELIRAEQFVSRVENVDLPGNPEGQSAYDSTRTIIVTKSDCYHYSVW